jgi:hypothetical protein
MRRISMFLPVLCCLAFVVQQSAARDDDTKDKSKEWVKGSVWQGIHRRNLSNGEVSTGAVTAIVTKREGKSFEGRFEFGDGLIVLEFEGEVDVTGKLNITITKIANASDEWKKGPDAGNVVGTKTPGTVDGKSATLTYRKSPGDPLKGASPTGTIKLKLKSDG